MPRGSRMRRVRCRSGFITVAVPRRASPTSAAPYKRTARPRCDGGAGQHRGRNVRAIAAAGQLLGPQRTPGRVRSVNDGRRWSFASPGTDGPWGRGTLEAGFSPQGRHQPCGTGGLANPRASQAPEMQRALSAYHGQHLRGAGPPAAGPRLAANHSCTVAFQRAVADAKPVPRLGRRPFPRPGNTGSAGVLRRSRRHRDARGARMGRRGRFRPHVGNPWVAAEG